MSKELFLLRGLPGAGKSTLAESLAITQCEADKYFMKEGTYKFDVTKLKEAHEWCQRECEKAMIFEVDVVVSNTFTQEWEMQAYYDLAKKYSYRVHSIIVENRHRGVNEHKVPQETLEKMKQRFEIKL
jgi:predicted kinase